MKKLIEKRKELEAKNAILAEVFKAAGDEYDFTKVKKIGSEDVSDWNTVKKTEKVRELNDELSALGVEVDELVALEKTSKDVEGREKAAKGGITHPQPTENGQTQPQGIKMLGEHLVAGKQFKSWNEQRKSGAKRPTTIELPNVWPSEILAAHRLKGGADYLTKTLMTTAAGYAPESTRIPRLTEAVTRPIEVLDLIPMERTGMAAIVYMTETTRTHAAVETAEGAAYPESQFVFTESTSTVRKIGDSIPVTDEQLDDVPMVEGYLNNRLIFGVRQRLDTQVMSGNGAGVNLTGILNTGSIQTQAKGVDPTPDAFYKAMTLIRVTGRSNPTAHVMHANDWQAIRLLRTADGIYIWGSPSEAGQARLWGLPVAITTVSENTGLVGDFSFCALFERAGVLVEMGYVDTQFTEGEKTLRAQMRAAFVVFRPTAFCTVTGI